MSDYGIKTGFYYWKPSFTQKDFLIEITKVTKKFVNIKNKRYKVLPNPKSISIPNQEYCAIRTSNISFRFDEAFYFATQPSAEDIENYVGVDGEIIVY